MDLENPIRFSDPSGAMPADEVESQNNQNLSGLPDNFSAEGLNQGETPIFEVSDSYLPTTIANRYEVRKNEDGSSTTTYINNDGGDETDYVTYFDEDGNVTGSLTTNVSVEWTSGPGAPPSIGKRVKHGKGHTELWAYGIIFDLFTGGAGSTGVSTSLGFAKLTPRVPKGQAFYDFLKSKVVKGGQWMRKKMNGYLRVLKKGDKIDDIPSHTHTTQPWEKR